MTLPRTTKTCRERITRTINCLRSLEQLNCWTPAMREPLLANLKALLERQMELLAGK